MVARPKRADPISTRPLYLPRAPILRQEPALPSAEPILRGYRFLWLFLDGVPLDLDLTVVAERIQKGHPRLIVTPLGELLPLALYPLRHMQRRHALADLANALAHAVVSDYGARGYEAPFHGDIEREKVLLGGLRAPGFQDTALWQASVSARRYDALRVQQALARIVPQDWQGHGRWHVVFTTRRLVLWDEPMGKWAPVIAVPGLPTLISLAAEHRDAAPPEKKAARILGGLVAA
ncbi:MAG: hypothetical protein HY684_04295 [Chloroflexi bacterium]|nr:hypothetical protein [Chloroflexota bacterium]